MSAGHTETAGLKLTKHKLYLCYVSVTITVEDTEGSYEVLCDVIFIIGACVLVQNLDARHPLQELSFVDQAISCHRNL